ncbi:adenyl-nucleotide exchange factor sse1 [Apophysomyces sp. BC1034]|nr:adenyl-nucleotide exchange factor sse1 [Apophysomyces sp. BC1015]KAG0182030.1 adenyl-nucleotide exchange factor sse1 [Apophysomyces sp. BC1021]KAG0193594.1 adenyl-nucleotide exchange factor sse1 [Apophysomyces sp. BC1034]
MSPVGFDLGNFQSIIAVARNGSVDIVCNEFSSRTTPSLVSFGAKQRYFGEPAKARELGALKDTVNNMKRFIGRTLNDPDVQEFEKKFMTAKLTDVDGKLGVKVNYLEEKTGFSAIQILAMHLNKLKETAAEELKKPVTSCVITVPGWFTDSQRRAVLDAAKVVKLNCLRLINDLTAVALDYGLSQSSLPKRKPKNVAFVDIGHSSYSVAIVSFLKDKLTVRGTAYDNHFGGRDFDHVVVEKLASEFKKYNIDVYSNKETFIKVCYSAERCKEELSTNPRVTVDIGPVVDGKSALITIDRAHFEEWASPLLSRIETVLQNALKNSTLKLDDIEAVKVVGGCTRIPAVKAIISKFFGKKVPATPDEESAARGAASQCAILLPATNFREFEVQDIYNYSVKAHWDAASKEENDVVIFGAKRAIPATKTITLHQRRPFTIEMYYNRPEDLPRGIKPWIGQYSIKDIKAVNGEVVQLKIMFRLNVHGIVSGVYAQAVDQKLVEEEVVDEKEDKKSTTAKKTTKTKKITKLVDRHVIARNTSSSRELINKYIEKEDQMDLSDKLFVMKVMIKNWLEENGYNFRDKILGPNATDIDPKLKDQFMSQFNALVDWTHNKGSGILPSMSIQELENIKNMIPSLTASLRKVEDERRVNPILRTTVECLNTTSVNDATAVNHATTKKNPEPTDHCKSFVASPSSPVPIHNPNSTTPPTSRSDAKTVKDCCSLMFTSPGTPSCESLTTVKTRAWRAGRSPGSVFFDITSFDGETKEVMKAIQIQYPNIVAGKTHKQGPQILAEINFDEYDSISKKKACTVGLEYKNFRIVAAEALQHEAHIIRLRLSDLPFLKPDKLNLGLCESLSMYGRILDVGISRDADFGLFMGNGYAVLDRYQPDNEPPFAELKHHIQWVDSTDCFYAFWRDMPLHCVFCHEPGHIRDDCPQRTINKIACLNCGEKGHSQASCLQFNLDAKPFVPNFDMDRKEPTETLLDLDMPTMASIPIQTSKLGYNELQPKHIPFTGNLIELDDDVIMVDKDDSIL